jgi:MerR family redox-sensitive transcriptional activator SoxR
LRSARWHRSGLAPTELLFHESRGLLIRSERSTGGQRLYRRHVLRRLAVIRVAERIGLTLPEIDAALARPRADRAPTRAEWERLSRGWRKELDKRIATLEGLRDDLTCCISWGCVSLQRCRLYNHDDSQAALGTGRATCSANLADVVLEWLGRNFVCMREPIVARGVIEVRWCPLQESWRWGSSAAL